MKFEFPGGEHATVHVSEGTVTIGSDPESSVVLKGEGIAPRHCVIAVKAGQGALRPLDAAARTVLNGRAVEGDVAIKSGDVLVFGKIGCMVGAQGPTAPAAAAARNDSAENQTRVRVALPKFMLRGVSGATLGKTFAVTDNAVIGRQADCDIALTAEEISRQHARLRVTPEGVYVEDLGSANGTFVNDKRVTSGLIKPGDELRLDTVRFQLLAPGMDARQQSASSRVGTGSGGSKGPLIAIVAVVVLAAIVAAVLLMK